MKSSYGVGAYKIVNAEQRHKTNDESYIQLHMVSRGDVVVLQRADVL